MNRWLTNIEYDLDDFIYSYIQIPTIQIENGSFFVSYYRYFDTQRVITRGYSTHIASLSLGCLESINV